MILPCHQLRRCYTWGRCGWLTVVVDWGCRCSRRSARRPWLSRCTTGRWGRTSWARAGEAESSVGGRPGQPASPPTTQGRHVTVAYHQVPAVGKTTLKYNQNKHSFFHSFIWIKHRVTTFGSRPSDHYFRTVCLSVCLFVCLCSFSQPSLIRFRSNLDISYMSGSSCAFII